jgi:hypothetical protein
MAFLKQPTIGTLRDIGTPLKGRVRSCPAETRPLMAGHFRQMSRLSHLSRSPVSRRFYEYFSFEWRDICWWERLSRVDAPLAGLHHAGHKKRTETGRFLAICPAFWLEARP